MTDDARETNNEDTRDKVGELVTIYRRGDMWSVNYQFQGDQIRKSLKTTSKKEARRRALEIERDLLAGKHKPQKMAPLISKVIDEYTNHLEAEGRSAKTLGKYRYCLGLLLEIAADKGKKRISQIDVALVDAYREERSRGSKERRPAKPKTVHNDTVTIRQLVNFAIKRGLVLDDPLKGLEIKKPKRTPQPCWTREEVLSILEASKPPHRWALEFLAETGARVGEAKWLAWDDVDFDRRQIHIRPKACWRPKSGDQRMVPMSAQLFAVLSNIPQDGRWVFSARATRQHPEQDRQISERRLLQYLKRVLGKLGLKGHLHTFRHSFISFAAYKGTPERVLRQWIGHVDRDILDWYFHLADEQSHDAMRRLAEPPTDSTKQQTSDDEGPDSVHSQHKPKEGENDRSAN